MPISGAVKIQSRCPTWLGLSALDFHFASQPLPLPLGWHALQAPPIMNRLAVAVTIGAIQQIALQIFILFTGNYNFFNFLFIWNCASSKLPVTGRTLHRRLKPCLNGDDTFSIASTRSASRAAQSKKIGLSSMGQPNDVAYKVNGARTVGRSYDNVVQMLQTQTRPLSIQFFCLGNDGVLKQKEQTRGPRIRIQVEMPKEMVLAMRPDLCSAVKCKNNNVIVAIRKKRFHLLLTDHDRLLFVNKDTNLLEDEIMCSLIVTVSSRSKYQALTISTLKTDYVLIDNFIRPDI
ncbi:hypothetical protein PPTG_03664 [Phytophthora nicotianae INRA-310]|uniref:Lipase maturation factor 1/2 N-terminal domain-containing protein n=1 Tax=Phytophthora nicotianae (strain INRA-310) TaxID=761204 RepID=W2R5R0_PHYN3|nr:hypothetical protein PPTG_03664 [Phytophthora nicotianae INRA-310]ETN20728.1 hypothetical protein PPTG_03664 [Phytophthora nicotianae INRA-310]